MSIILQNSVNKRKLSSSSHLEHLESVNTVHLVRSARTLHCVAHALHGKKTYNYCHMYCTFTATTGAEMFRVSVSIH